MDKQGVPKEGRVLRVTENQVKELRTLLRNPAKIPTHVLGCALEVV